MRRIHRHYLTRGPDGRVVVGRIEKLTDDGNGWMQLLSEQQSVCCSGCRRPIIDLSELRGTCDWCHTRGCCVHCLSQCQVCSRRLCGTCRMGFAGPPALTVCAVCHGRLTHRQAFHDQLAVQQTAFDRQIAQQRLLIQLEGLRLAADRLQLSANMQAARLGLNRPPPFWRRMVAWTLMGISKSFSYVCRFLR